MQKTIIHLMNKKWFKTDTFELEMKLLWEIYVENNVESILFYKWSKIEDKEFEDKLNRHWIYIENYLNRDKIIEKVLKFHKSYNVLYIHTTIETTMNLTNDLKKIIWQKSPKNHKIFRDKFIQRDMIQKHCPNLWIRFLAGGIKDLSFSKIRDSVWLPFILKPTNWVQSSGVVKITSRREFNNYKDNYVNFNKVFIEKGIDTDKLIAEEFIDGELYSIDYFVWEDSNIRISEPIKEKLGIDIKVDDYFVLCRITTKDTQDTFRYINLEKFIKDTVDAMKIKNSFVHHEFKINSKWEIKTIEVNGRIWWWRHELMYRAFGINFFKFIIDSRQDFPTIKENVIWINVLATRLWTLSWFNNKLFDKIKELESVYEILKDTSFIWKECWLTKDWFWRVWTIKLSNKNLKQLNRDYEYIEKNYKKLLIIKYKYLEITKIIKIFKLNIN